MEQETVVASGTKSDSREALDSQSNKNREKVTINKQSLLEAGAHFGHKTKDWNPKTLKYLYGTHNQIHVINLFETVKMWPEVRQAIVRAVSEGMEVLFVGTKHQASETIALEAKNCGQPYVSNKWKGGTLTNLKTMRCRIDYLERLNIVLNDPEKSKRYVKKELLKMTKKRDKLEDTIGGIKNMVCYPGMVFVIDPRRERTAMLEAKKLNIPIISLLDSNCNPDDIDFFVPANDDAVKTLKLFIRAVADAVIEGKQIAAQKNQTGEELNPSEFFYGVEENVEVETPVE